MSRELSRSLGTATLRARLWKLPGKRSYLVTPKKDQWIVEITASVPGKTIIIAERYYDDYDMARQYYDDTAKAFEK